MACYTSIVRSTFADAVALIGESFHNFDRARLSARVAESSDMGLALAKEDELLTSGTAQAVEGAIKTLQGGNTDASAFASLKQTLEEAIAELDKLPPGRPHKHPHAQAHVHAEQQHVAVRTVGG